MRNLHAAVARTHYTEPLFKLERPIISLLYRISTASVTSRQSAAYFGQKKGELVEREMETGFLIRQQKAKINTQTGKANGSRTA